MQNIMTGPNFLNSRAGRAGEILNPFRGLSLRHSFPISPFANAVMGEDEDQEDAVDSDSKNIDIIKRYHSLWSVKLYHDEYMSKNNFEYYTVSAEDPY